MTQDLLRRVVWDEFPRTYEPESYEHLRGRARERTLSFMRNAYGIFNLAAMDDVSAVSHRPDLDRWCASEIGQRTLVSLVTDIHDVVRGMIQHALPAHDTRQILFKDAAEALRFAMMEKPQGYKSFFVIAAFAHDLGRLAEGLYYCPENQHDHWIPHAHFSFLMFEKILAGDAYADMPQDLKNHMLYAVAAHSGINGNTYFSQATQACDRVQLIGPEGFFRGVVYVAGLTGGEIAYPDGDDFERDLPNMHDHNSALSVLEYFSRNMYPTLGTVHQDWTQKVQIQNLALLMMSASHSSMLYQKIFAPEVGVNLNFGARKQPLDPQLFGQAVRLSNLYREQLPDRDVSAQSVMQDLVGFVGDLPGAAPITPDAYTNMAHCLGRMTRDERRGFSKAMIVAEKMQQDQDKIDADLCRDCVQSDNLVYRAIARNALQVAPQHCVVPPPLSIHATPGFTPFVPRVV